MRHFSKLCFLSAIILLLPISLSANSVSDVTINEIAWMGTINSANSEWIELYNNTNQPIDLTGWTLSSADGTPSITIEPSKTIPAQGFFLLERTSDGTLPNVAADQIYTGALGNLGENLELKDSSGNLIDSVNCSSGWFAGDNATKQTMERKNPSTSGNDASNWQTSQSPGGTPRAQNSSGSSEQQEEQQEQADSEITSTPASGAAPANQPPKAEAGPDIIALINQEIIFDASKSSDSNNDPLAFSWNFGDGTTSDKITFTHSYRFPGKYIVSLTASDSKNSSTDTLIATIYSNSIVISEFLPNPEGKDDQNEWIELYNNSSQAADLSSWKIDTGEDSKAFSFPANTTIAGNQYLVFARPTTKISLNNTSGKVRLIFPTSQISQEIKYEKAVQGQSVNLIKGNEYIWSATPTPSLSNIISNKVNKTASNLNAIITEATENNSIPSALIPAYPVITPNPFSQNAINNISDSQQSANVDNVGINQGNKDDSVSNNNNNNPSQTQSAAISKLFQNKLSSTITIIIIIFFGLATGLGLIFARNKLRQRANKITTDWQD